MKWIARTYLLLTAMAFVSCISPSKLPGIYKLKSEWPGAVVLYLNADHTFVEFVGGDVCGNTNYFGYYTVKNRHLSLNPISHNLNYIGKKDTIIYKHDPRYKTKEIYLYENEDKAYEGAKIFTNDNKYLGTTNTEGLLKLPSSPDIDSLLIKPIFGPFRNFYIGKKPFNQLFIMLYDYSFVPCSDFYYSGRFITTKKGLEIIRNIQTGKKKKNFYLKKIEL